MTLYTITRLTPEGIHYKRPGKGGGYFAAYPISCDRVDSFVWREDADGVRQALEWEGITYGQSNHETGYLEEIAVAGEIPVTIVEDAVSAPQGSRAAMTVEEIKSRMLIRLEQARYEREIGGMDFMGMRIPTDRATQSKLDTAHRRATDNPDYSVKWKIGFNEWVDLDSATIIAIGDAMEAHVRDAFAWEAEKAAEIVAATTKDQINAIDITI